MMVLFKSFIIKVIKTTTFDRHTDTNNKPADTSIQTKNKISIIQFPETKMEFYSSKISN